MSTLIGERQLQLDSPSGPLDASWNSSKDAVAQFVFAHGAGAGYQHATMQSLASAFAEVGIATLRFNFPFMQQGKRRVDRTEDAVLSILSAVELAREQSSLPLYLAGHSFGGRMCSHALVDTDIDCVGAVFCSFPLHLAKKPSVKRAEHLPNVDRPMLFLSGTRDDLAQADLLQQAVDQLSSNARIHWLETANHSYTILKRTRQNPMPIFTEMAQAARKFIDQT